MRGTIKRDPVCGKKMNRNKAYAVVRHRNREYLLCCARCQSEFESNPELYCRDARSNENRT